MLVGEDVMASDFTNSFTLPPEVVAEKWAPMEEKMNNYTLQFVYIGIAAFVASSVQVNKTLALQQQELLRLQYFQVACWTTSCERQVHKMR